MFSEEYPSARGARPKNILCCSGGNDSVALIQWAYENELRNVTVLFNDTGWAISWWDDRMADIVQICRKYNFQFRTTESIGFKDLVRAKKAFPMAASKMSFCSEYLKKKPTREWLKEHDPFHTATIYVGISPGVVMSVIIAGERCGLLSKPSNKVDTIDEDPCGVPHDKMMEDNFWNFCPYCGVDLPE